MKRSLLDLKWYKKICLEGLKEKYKTSVRKVAVPVEIRGERHLVTR
jgi:hypothetical protein